MIQFQQNIEAQNLQQLAYGTASAKTMTLSWYMKSTSFVEPISIHLETIDGTQEYFQVNRTPTTSWARYSVTIPGSTTATINSDNGNGLRINFNLSAAQNNPNFQASDSTAWSTTAIKSQDDQGNFVDDTANYLQFTGVQLELGSNATPFEHRSYGDELARCERYFQTLLRTSTTGNRAVASLNAYTTAIAYGPIQYIRPMRSNIVADNIVTTFSNSANWRVYGNGTYTDGSTLAVDTISGDSCRLSVSPTVANLTQGYSYWVQSVDTGQYITVENEIT